MGNLNYDYDVDDKISIDGYSKVYSSPSSSDFEEAADRYIRFTIGKTQIYEDNIQYRLTKINLVVLNQTKYTNYLYKRIKETYPDIKVSYFTNETLYNPERGTPLENGVKKTYEGVRITRGEDKIILVPYEVEIEEKLPPVQISF